MISHSQDDKKRIEVVTQRQSKFACWFEERFGRITSLHFGALCKGNITSKVEAVISSGRFDSKQPAAAIQWGIMHEDTAYKFYQSTSPIVIMYIRQEYSLPM